jgi:hypothetical protein
VRRPQRYRSEQCRSPRCALIARCAGLSEQQGSWPRSRTRGWRTVRSRNKWSPCAGGGRLPPYGRPFPLCPQRPRPLAARPAAPSSWCRDDQFRPAMLPASSPPSVTRYSGAGRSDLAHLCEGRQM